ncbi:aspartate/glutamate racemase family protein [Kitasatospora purpeofusca]|uniref:glutamate racemase n=1 Tax=Kitasatospora purpeofusca TaxID=67352 RepID=UPI002E0ECE03|nr:aspartate/glutamate racemase family protein [Kitasatospora purpeofusca]WSR44032.1 aspartate/glutamate racemase family protein [Kitasatospora purpeofusca]
MKIALMDSGIGLLAAAGVLRTMRPDVDLVLSSNPASMPWGPRTPEEITELALGCARAAAAHEPDALIIACNTASVHALAALRAELEPALPVIATVPAIKPASALGGPVAIWATPATTGSTYQRGLIRDFAGTAAVTEVACPGLADAVDHGDRAAIDAAIADAAARTPAGTAALVLGCTHYELVADRIRAAVAPTALPTLTLHGSAEPVVAQALRRVADPTRRGNATLTVLHAGVPTTLPTVALAYPGTALLGAAPLTAPAA